MPAHFASRMRTLRKIVRSLLLCAVFSSQGARADVLFIDLNLNSSEVEAARRALAHRNPPEKLIVLPPIPSSVRVQAERAARASERVSHLGRHTNDREERYQTTASRW